MSVIFPLSLLALSFTLRRGLEWWVYITQWKITDITYATDAHRGPRSRSRLPTRAGLSQRSSAAICAPQQASQRIAGRALAELTAQHFIYSAKTKRALRCRNTLVIVTVPLRRADNRGPLNPFRSMER
jgi:hypothetical protein